MSNSYNGNVGNSNSIIGANNHGNSINGSSSSFQKNQNSQNGSSYKHDFGVLIAKDKEIDCLNLFFEKFGYDKETLDKDGSPYFVTKIEGKSVAFSYLNDMGYDNMKEGIQEFIKKTAPRFVATIGICASSKNNLAKVLLFTASKVGDFKGPPTIVNPNINKLHIPNLFREENFIVEHKKPLSYIYTMTLKDPHQEEDEEKSNKILTDNEVDGIDMEIGAVFEGILEWNKYASYKVIPLPALKASSDYGTKAVRKEKAKEAAINASKAFILYVKWLIQQGLC